MFVRVAVLAAANRMVRKMRVGVDPIAAANNVFFIVDGEVAHFMGHFFL
jgi:hypothetical protein